MIPVLIAPVLNRPDLLAEMLDSIDVPVDRTIIVDNSPDGIALDRDVEWIRGVSSFGYPGSINVGIMQTPHAPWWLFASNDIRFGPGDLAEIASHMDTPEPRVVTGDRRDARMLRWAYGALNAATVQAVGLMDEHAFYPIYFDDDDYERRCLLAGIRWIVFNGSIEHGDGRGSMTIRSDERLADRNRITFELNRAQYEAKWGGTPTAETYSTPYAMSVPLSFVRPDPIARAARSWDR